MRMLADTNVVSELLKPVPSQNVVDWFHDHQGNVYLSSISIMELYYGAMRLPAGKRRDGLTNAITAIVMDCSDKTFSFDPFCGFLCAQLENMAIEEGRGLSREDAMIAAICSRNECVLATRNVKDFDFLGIELENPFEYVPRAGVNA